MSRPEIKIGFETYPGEGPGIFLTRLKQVLERLGRFDAEQPDVWIQLSFKPLPDTIAERQRQGLCKIAVRMDGAYCNRHTKIKWPCKIPCKLLDDPYSQKINDRQNAAIKASLLAADQIVFQSEFSRKLTQRFVTPTSAGVVIHNGIDLSAFQPAHAPKADTPLKLLVSHSFRPYHRLHDHMRILAALKKNRPDTQLHILGQGDATSLEHARGIAEDLKLVMGQDFFFLGKLPAEELSGVYQSAHLMLNLSYWDSCPNVVIEALACGLPVVGVNYGGVAELVGSDADAGGLLVDEAISFDYIAHHDFRRMPKAPVPKYVEAILQAASQQTVLSQQARRRAETRFNIEQVAQRYMDTLSCI